MPGLPCRRLAVSPGSHPRPLWRWEVFICRVGSIFKKRFSCLSEGAKYSTGINREIDIKSKCPCENHAWWKALFKKA